MNPTIDPQLLKLYEKLGIELPSHEEHGQFDKGMLEPFQATRWWLEGDVLYAEGNHGVVANRIPTDYICLGMDERNLPILKKIDIN